MDDSLTHRTVKNSIYSLGGFIWPLLLAFVLTPIIIKGLGSARFGFYSLLNGIPLIFGLLDFGISYTFIKRLSERRGQNSDAELSEIFSTTVILYGIIGLIGFISLVFLQGVFRFWFKIPEGFVSSYGLAFFILGSSFFLQMLIVPLSQIPYALQRQDLATKVSLANSTFLQISSVILLKNGHSVLSLLIIQLISASGVLLTYYFIWHKIKPDLKFAPMLSTKIVKTIGRQGIWLFIRNNMGNVLGQLDKFVLGLVWGPAAVGYYSTAQMVPEKISSTSFSLSHIFFPIFSEVSSGEDGRTGRMKAVFRRSLGLIAIAASGLTVLVLIYGYQLVYYWVNPDFAEKTMFAVPILALTYFLLAFGNFFQAFLGGLNELKFLAVATMLLAVLDVIFMFILIPRYSINGASWAYLISALPMPIFLYYIEKKYLNSSSTEILHFYGRLLTKIFLTGSLVWIFGWFVFRPMVDSLFVVVVLGGLTFGIYLFAAWLFNLFSSEDKALFRHYRNEFLPGFSFKK